jgi:hypothetical protein
MYFAEFLIFPASQFLCQCKSEYKSGISFGLFVYIFCHKCPFGASGLVGTIDLWKKNIGRKSRETVSVFKWVVFAL